MKRFRSYLSSLLLGLSVWTPPGTSAELNSDQNAVAETLDRFHKAAAQHDFKAYFDLFAEDGVFLGTDAKERWTAAEFKEYVRPYFQKGQGWTYIPKQRNISLAPDGKLAWFDELLENPKYGTCRGTGVLRRKDKAWVIQQYHLTIPVPNELAKQLVQWIRDLDKK